MEYICKKIDDKELTHSSIHHLLAINNLIQKNGYARAIDIAKHLGLTRGSVSITLKKLTNKNYIIEDSNKFYQLSDKGKKNVNAVVSKRHIVEQFFKDVLQLPADVAEIDGCKIGYLLSQETGEKLLSFIGYCLSDNKQIKSLLNDFINFNQICQSVENCQVCEMECFFAGGSDELLNK